MTNLDDQTPFDCVVIGYNETPFTEYAKMIRSWGEDGEAYRDLKMSFLMKDGNPLLYVDLMSQVFDQDLKSCDIPNLASVYLCNYLARRGKTCTFINLFQHEKERLADILRNNPLCVAITTTFYVMNHPVNEMVKFIRSINKDVLIIVGGVLVSNHHNSFTGDDFIGALRDMGADIFVLESQGEATLNEIIDALKEGRDLAGVSNLYYFKNEVCYNTPRKAENNSLDQEAIDWRVFSHTYLGKTIQTRTARSCAFGCAFCGYPERGGPLTLASMETVERELESVRSLGYVENVVFIDDTFNVPKARFKDFLKMLIERQFKFNWFSYYRCDHGDEEVIDLMQKSGCKGVFLGIESGSQDVLLKMNKRAKVENYVKGIRNLKERGILTFTSLITGYPGESESTIAETKDFIRSTRPDYWRTQLWYCDPLTPVYKTRKEEFKIQGEGFKWEHFTMNSMEACNYIEEMFLQLNDTAVWLPQYSFDFWIIPYIMGKGISLEELKQFMAISNKLLTVEIASIGDEDKALLQASYHNEFDSIRYRIETPRSKFDVNC